jgi:3-deoxy-D-manno-octulosonic-acid transferase
LKPFDLFYLFVAALLYLLALPFLIYLSFKAKYKTSIPARFFLKHNPPFEKKGIWFHACSLGEARALKPILDRLENEVVNITTITQTGQEEAKKYRAAVRYLPYELFLPFWVGEQKFLVVLEAEFWYLLFAVARARGARIVLVNARMTERSFPKYKKLGWFYGRLFSHVEKVFCQSEADKGRFEALGAGNIEVIGNIKLAQQISASASYAKPDGETIVAASTHEGEEEAVLDAFLDYRATHPSRLIVVPRHPERFGAVWKLIEGAEREGLTLSRWSEEKSLEADIVLVDAMGELNNIYAISDVAILGGAFRDDVGGHNPLEPAHFGCKVITGKHAFMQKELFRYVSHVQEVEPGGLRDALEKTGTMPASSVDEKVDLERIVSYLK